MLKTQIFIRSEFFRVVKIILLIIIALFLIFSSPTLVKSENTVRTPVKATSSTAILNMDLGDSTSSDEILLDISVDPGGQSINAVGVFIFFSTSTLEATSINIENSFCDLFIEHTIDNKEGKISIQCGKPYPGINVESPIAQISFKTQKSPDATWNGFKFDDNSMVLANDGFGTDVLKTKNNIRLYSF